MLNRHRLHARCALLSLSLVLAACAGDPALSAEEERASPPREAVLPSAWDQQLAMAPLEDRDPSPRVVDVALSASVQRVELEPGHTVEAYTYNGVSPGPVIRANVGDTLRVHFENHLPEPTTIHWHGLEVPADQDGAGHDGTEILPGASFDYEFTVPSAGTYWYHPHFNSAAQVWRGLYGALIVDDPKQPDLGDELTLVLHDVQLEPDTGEIEPPAAQGDLGRFFGHEGYTLLVNGRIAPHAQVYPGSTLRLRIINASISRYYRVGVDGHGLTRVGGDSGLSSHAEQVEDVLLVPGERAELLLTIQAAAGTALTMRSLPYDRFECSGCSFAEPLMTFDVVEGQGTSFGAPAQLATIPPVDTRGAQQREVVFAETVRNGKTMLALNGQVFGQDTLMLHATVGSREVWTLRNTTDYDHPFHLHGFRFQVLSVNGQPPARSEWKDTLNLPRHGQAQIVVQYDDRPGMWMFHCHILDHAEIGMMGMLHLSR